MGGVLNLRPDLFAAAIMVRGLLMGGVLILKPDLFAAAIIVRQALHALGHAVCVSPGRAFCGCADHDLG
eukprot:1156669-Pelagomonas_calceolata.AAC.5